MSYLAFCLQSPPKSCFSFLNKRMLCRSLIGHLNGWTWHLAGGVVEVLCPLWCHKELISRTLFLHVSSVTEMMEFHHLQAQTKTEVYSFRKVALPLYQEFSGSNLRRKSIRKTPFLIESAVKIQNLRRLHFSVVSLPSGLSVSVNQIPMNNATAPRYFQGRIFTSWQVKEAWSPKWECRFFFFLKEGGEERGFTARGER